VGTARNFKFIALSSVLASPTWAAPDDLPTYRAVYRVEQAGEDTGTSEWTLTYDADREIYHFVSSLSAKGALRLALPNPIVERAEFKYDNGEIQPLQFWYEDGSRKGEENSHTVFDWTNSRAVTNGRGTHTEVELRPGILDRASMQIAVMRDMASAEGPRDYLLADGDGIKLYRYSQSGDEALDVPVGIVQTRVFVQQREGSSRRLLLWAAPELAFLPVRMEQQKNAQTDVVFTLEFVELNGARRP
jgi:hypothetical protein